MDNKQELVKEKEYICLKREGTKKPENSLLLKEYSMDIFVNGKWLLHSICTKEYIEELVIGHLKTSGIIQEFADIEKIEIKENELYVTVKLGQKEKQEQILTAIKYPDEWIFTMADNLEKGMPLYRQTKAIHSCFLYQEGKLLFACEDIGRHNAMDKVIGYALKNNIDLRTCAVYSSGRVPTDMVTKAIRAGIPVLVSKGIPTGDSVELAKKYKLTLICGARKDQIKIYADYRKKDTDALILAGGKSSRMGGKHKGNLIYGEETFVQHLIKEVSKITDNIWISYGQDIHAEYENCKIVKDQYPNCGPISGIHAGFSATDSEKMLVVACDMPFMEATFFEKLESWMTEDVDGVVPKTADGRIHPLAAIYRKSILPVLEEKIKEGNYRLRDAFDKLRIKYVDVNDDAEMIRMLGNINTVEEYKVLEKPIQLLT